MTGGDQACRYCPLLPHPLWARNWQYHHEVAVCRDLQPESLSGRQGRRLEAPAAASGGPTVPVATGRTEHFCIAPTRSWGIARDPATASHSRRSHHAWLALMLVNDIDVKWEENVREGAAAASRIATVRCPGLSWCQQDP